MGCCGEAYVSRLCAARAGGYAIGSFNLDSLDVLGHLVRRAAELHSPIIFQFGPWSESRLTIEQIGAASKALCSAGAGAFVHLDHGRDEEFIRRSLDAGFDSVMFDGSGETLEENIARTRDVVRMGHEAGAAVEGAVGALERGVDTCVDDARRFVAATGIDALGVAVGTGHGQDRDAADIDIERLHELSALGVPLVIHGGSGLPLDVMAEVRRSAVAKINVATALFHRCREATQLFLESDDVPAHPSALIGVACDAFWEVVRERMERFGCLGKEAAVDP